MRVGMLTGLALGMIAATGSAQEPAGDIESITYETAGCFGTCPVYRVRVSPGGSGWFQGLRFTAVEGERTFRITRAQYDAFAARVAPHRPRDGLDITYGSERCRRFATDHPGANVTWERGNRRDWLNFNFGCRDAANAALARALTEAPGLLPIGDYIGPR